MVQAPLLRIDRHDRLLLADQNELRGCRRKAELRRWPLQSRVLPRATLAPESLGGFAVECVLDWTIPAWTVLIA